MIGGKIGSVIIGGRGVMIGLPHCSPRSCSYSLSMFDVHSHLQPYLGSRSKPDGQRRAHWIYEKQAQASESNLSKSSHSDWSEA